MNRTRQWRSVDFGPGTVEILCERVTTRGVYTETMYTGEVDPTEVVAWLEYHDVTVELRDDSVRIGPINKE